MNTIFNFVIYKKKTNNLEINNRVAHILLFKEQFKYLKTTHSYHLVDPSPWPVVAALGAFMITSGLVLYMHKFTGGWALFQSGFLMIFYVMYTWWRDVIREATFEEQHSVAVQKGLRLGMILCALLRLLFCCMTRQSYTYIYSTLCGSTPRVAVTVMCCGKALGDGGVKLNISC